MTGWVVASKYNNPNMYETPHGTWWGLAHAKVYATQAAAEYRRRNHTYSESCQVISLEEAQTLVTLEAL